MKSIIENIRKWIVKLDEHPTRSQVYYYENIRQLLKDAKEIKSALSTKLYDFFVREISHTEMSALDCISLAKDFLKEQDPYYSEERFQALWNDGVFGFTLQEKIDEDCYEEDHYQAETYEMAEVGVKNKHNYLDISFKGTILDASILVHEWFHLYSLEAKRIDRKEERFSELLSIYAELQFLVWLREKGYPEKEIQRAIYHRMVSTNENLNSLLVKTALLCSCIDGVGQFDQILEEKQAETDEEKEKIAKQEESLMQVAREAYLPEVSEEEFRKYSQEEFCPNIDMKYVFGTGLSFYLSRHQVPLSKVILSISLAVDPKVSEEEVYTFLGLPKDFTWYDITLDALEGMEELLFPPKKNKTTK